MERGPRFLQLILFPGKFFSLRIRRREKYIISLRGRRRPSGRDRPPKCTGASALTTGIPGGVESRWTLTVDSSTVRPGAGKAGSNSFGPAGPEIGPPSQDQSPSIYGRRVPQPSRGCARRRPRLTDRPSTKPGPASESVRSYRRSAARQFIPSLNASHAPRFIFTC